MDWKKSRLSFDLTSKLRTMVEKSHNRTIIGIMLEAKVKRTVTLTVENTSRLLGNAGAGWTGGDHVSLKMDVDHVVAPA
jgi:hypothetical protein